MSLPQSWLCVAGMLALVMLPMASADNGDAQESLSTETTPRASEKILSRHRRYLVFPEGSTFTCAFCLSIKAYIIRDIDIYTAGVAWGISYDLPNNSREISSAGAGIGPDELRRKGRRDRRDLYRRLEVAANSAGMDGRSCVLRAVCEARDLPGEKEKAPKSLPLELLRTILNVPVDYLASHEPYEHHEYVSARRLGMEGADCERHYRDCPISFVSVASNLLPAISPFT